MPTVSEIPENVAESQAVAPVDQYDDFIDERLERTSFHLKTLDLVTSLIWLGLVLFGSLLILVLVDHWIVGLSVWARLLSLGAITSITLYMAIQRVLMPLFRSINPEYAALTVEHAHPELKNGLINFLFFRERPDQLRQGVYQGIQHQAVSDLTAVPIDSAVDRSAIIRLGYCLVALAVVWVGYILLSPKNPLQTLQRIALPWRDIARPSQVDILEVTPGNIEIFRGQSVEIKAKVDGLKSGESPSIIFATLDGQLVDRHIALAGNGNAGRYSGMLTTSGSGIQQDLEYRIRAGDAISQLYAVTVTEAPHILVDRLEFDYPSYTGQADEIVQGEGDIHAIEGTRITVIGKANQSIQRGHIEFVQAAETPSSAPKRASLKVKGSPATEAEVQFPLRMNAERNAALYRGYRLQFTNETGQTSVDPIEHTIAVIPDLRPVVQILTPDRRTIELPENSWQQIEVRAVDPDFKLTRVQLAARTRGRNLFKENLLTTTRASEWHTGQFTASYRFVPRDFGLQDGDVVEYLAVAEDNRHALSQNKLDPNPTITAKQYIRIVKSDPLAEDPPSDSTSKSEDPPQEPGAENRTEDSEGNKNQQTQSEQSKGDQQSKGDSNAEQQQEGEKGSQSEEGDQNEQQESGDSQNNESGLQQNSDNGGGETQEQSEGGSPGESNESNSERDSVGESSGDRSSDQANENDQGEKNDQHQDSTAGSDGNSEGESGENTGQNASGEKQGESGEPEKNGAGDENNGRGAREDEPLPSSGERDGEVVERIREHMQENGDLDPYEQEQQEKQDNGGGEAAAEDETDTGSSQPTSEQEQDTPGADPSDSDQNKSDGGEGDDPQSASKQDSHQQTSGEQGSKQQEPKDGAGQPSEQQSDDGSKKTDTGKSDTGRPEDAESQSTQPDEKQSEPGTAEPGESGDPQAPTGSDEDPATDEQPGASQDPGEPSTGESGNENVPQNGEKTDSGNNSPKNQGEQESENGGAKPFSEQTESGKDQPSDQLGEPEADSGKADGTSQDSQSSKSKASPTGTPEGDSDAGDGQTTDGSDPNDAATGDDANLEYTRKATDFVLEYLRDQNQKPDQELLDKLGWKQDDVDKFVRRWDEMKRNAKGSDQVSQQNKSKLDEMLKGMGLESPTANLRRATNRDDRQRDNRNTGRKRKVPTELLDPFRAFQRGLQQKK